MTYQNIVILLFIFLIMTLYYYYLKETTKQISTCCKQSNFLIKFAIILVSFIGAERLEPRTAIIFLITILLAIIIGMPLYNYMYNIENFSICCKDSDILKKYAFMDTKPFEHEKRFGNSLDYEYNP